MCRLQGKPVSQYSISPEKIQVLPYINFQPFLIINDVLGVSKVDLNGRTNSVVRKELNMLWTICVILFVLWLLGFLGGYAAGGLIHILLVIAIIVLVVQLIQGRR